MHRVLGLILGGGQGARLYPLTRQRSEPAVPVAGKYRLIDIPVSNCLNAGVNRVYVLTQYHSVSLHRHIASTYKFSPFSHGFVEVLAAQQTNESADWYRGTADALRQNIRYVLDDAPRDVLVLSGDQLYCMDFARLLHDHRASKADVTIAVTPVLLARAAELGIVRLDAEGRVRALIEKPQTEDQLDALRTPPEELRRLGAPPDGRQHLANMGIYLFRQEVLTGLLAGRPEATDLVHDVLRHCLDTHRVRGWLFTGYWEDLGIIRSYFEANLALAGDNPPFDFHTPEGVIYSRMRNLPASRVSAAHLKHCLISDGCLVEAGTRLERCVLGVRSRLGRGVQVRDAIILGADEYETDAERAANRAAGRPDLGVGDGSVIERAILDRDCRVGRNVQIVNRRGVIEEEGANYVIRDGIVVIPNGAVVPDGTVI